ncbi:MAG: aldolase [Planctomycetes bacterium]|nr:aldolase [Planctomycetota bacterium]
MLHELAKPISSQRQLPSPLSVSRLLLFLSVLIGIARPAEDVVADEVAAAPKRINRFIELMESNKPAFGIFSSNVSLRAGAAISGSKLDFVIVDMEHSPYDPTRLESYLAGMTAKADVLKSGLQVQTVPLIRVPAAGREQLQFVIKQVLDLGPLGVVVPHVDTAEDARAMVQACRFPQLKTASDFEPQGKRGVGYGWAARQWGLSGGEYAQRADLWPLDTHGELLLWVMIESESAVKNIRAIAGTPGISGLFIGPSDLAFSLGVPLGDPAVEEAIASIVAAAKEADVPLGTLCGGGEVEKRLAQGFRFLAVGSDGGVSASVQEAVKRGRSFKQKP